MVNPWRKMHTSERNQSRLEKRDYRPTSVRARVDNLWPMPSDDQLSDQLPTDQSPTADDPISAGDPIASERKPDWQTSVDKIRTRKTQERRPVREGDPQKFRKAAAEITARQVDGRLMDDRPVGDRLAGDRLVGDRLIDDRSRPDPNLDDLILDDSLIDDHTFEVLPLTSHYAALSMPMQAKGYAHWRQIVGETFLEHQIVEHDLASQRVDMVLGKAVWQILQQFGVEVAYVFLLLASKATRSRNPWEELVELNTQEILNLNIWDKDSDPAIGRRLRTVGNWVELVCNLSLLVSQVNPATQRFKALRIPFWVMEEMEYSGVVTSSVGTGSLVSYQPEECRDLTIRVGLGLWNEQFVDVPEDQKQEALGRFGYQANSILQINPKRKLLASKLAILLLLLNQSSQDQFYSIGGLLEQVESKATIIEMHRLKERRSYFWSRWNTAIHALQKLGWQLEFDAKTYPEMLRPAWYQSDVPVMDIDDARWLRAWLAAKIRITPPQLPQVEVAPLDLPLAERFTGRTLAHALELKGLSRSKLAEHLSLDRSMVTYWIKGSRLIQPRHREQICDLLGTELEQVLEQV